MQSRPVIHTRHVTRREMLQKCWFQVAEAVVGIFLTFSGISYALHNVEHLVEVHEIFILFYPILGVFVFAGIIPFVMYISFIDQFGPKHMIWPPHYFWMVRRIFTAATGTGRVGAKDF